MNMVPNITDTEWIIMKVLWQYGPCNAVKIIEALEGQVAWKPKTIKTLINHLLNKKAIGYRVDAHDPRAYEYFPLLSEEECLKKESQSFLNRLFNGNFNTMVSFFLEKENLSQKEIKELKEILVKTDEGK